MKRVRAEEPSRAKKRFEPEIKPRESHKGARKSAKKHPVLIKERKIRKRRNKRKYLMEIKKYQASEKFLIPLLPFRRLTKEILDEMAPSMRITSSALGALQTATEAYITGLIEDGYLCTLHRERVTIQAKDLHLATTIRGDDK